MKQFLTIFFGLVFVLNGLSQKVTTPLVYVVKEPSKKTAKTPIIIMLHGYGSNESDLFDLSKALDERFMVFSLRAPNPVSSGYAWYHLDFLPNQQFKYSYPEAVESRTKILSFISNACAAYGADSSQVFLMGFSQGAIMAYDIALASPGKIKGVLALSGRMMEESKALKTDWKKAVNVKFFIAHGNSDNVIKISDGEKASEFLKTKKVTDLTYNTYEMPHSLNGKELNDMKQWLVKAIQPKQAESKK